MILLVDYGAGNLRSVEKACQHIGLHVRRGNDPQLLSKAKGVIVPGVGSFDHAVESLERLQLFHPIQEAVSKGMPYIGLCLGLQLLFRDSDEGQRQGFGLMRGKVLHFPHYHKVPHMGWNQIQMKHGSPLFMNLSAKTMFYFVHSYFIAPFDSNTVDGYTQYGVKFASVIKSKNIVATQFHPEKSQEHGLIFLRNAAKYLEWL